MAATTRGDLSPSKISLHPFSRSGYACLRHFREKYVARRRAPRPTSAMTRGNAVHKVLELAAKARVEHVALAPEADLGELLGYAENALGAVGAMLTRQGYDELRQALELMAPVHLGNVLAVEKFFNFEVDGVRVAGKVDRVDEVTLGTPLAEKFDYLVIDYKSGGVQSTKELEEQPQTLIYLEGVHEAFVGARVGMVYDFVRAGHVAPPIAWSPETSVKTRALITAVWADLEERKKSADGDDAWPGLAGSHCKGCSYQTGCGAYAALLASGTEVAPPAETLATEDLLKEFVRARDASSLNEERKKECGKEIMGRIGGGEDLVGGDLKAHRVVTPKNEIHLATLVQGVAEALGTTEDAVSRSLVREIHDPKKLKELQAGLDKETRAKVTKALEDAKIPVSTSAYPRVGEFDPFGEGEE